MPADDPKERLCTWISSLQRNRAVLEMQIQELDDKRRELHEKLNAIVRVTQVLQDTYSSLDGLPEDALEALEADIPPSGETHKEKIENFFRLRKNEPATVQEISAGTRIMRASVSAVLYRTHTEDFDRVGSDDGRGQRWQLRDYVEPEPEPPSESDDEIPF
jgi:hypothetical protein